MIRFWKKILFVLFASAFLASAQELPLKPVKYVFLFIGDGMGENQRLAGEEYAKHLGQKGLTINSLPCNAPMTTHAANSAITDSAASGTAIASGCKTNIWHVGVNPKGEPLESIAHTAGKAGKKVGIISNKNMNDATPAAFYAHNQKRNNDYQIALDMLSSGFDYFGGGGFIGHNDGKDPKYRGDIYELAQKAGYTVEYLPARIKMLKPGGGKLIVGVKGDRMPYAESNRSLTLADYLAKGIELLDNDKGFFIMCEGGRIDWACHANSARLLLGEIIDFDNAVKVAYEFAQKHPKDTLIIVTADHETGGFFFGKKNTGYEINYDLLKKTDVSKGYFATIFIKQKKAQTPYTFADLKKEVETSYKTVFPGGTNPKAISRITPEEEKELEAMFQKYFVNGSNNVDYYSLDRELMCLFNKKAGFGWKTTGHTDTPVITSAYGVNAEAFSRPLDNTDIGKRLKQAVR